MCCSLSFWKLADVQSPFWMAIWCVNIFPRNSDFPKNIAISTFAALDTLPLVRERPRLKRRNGNCGQDSDRSGGGYPDRYDGAWRRSASAACADFWPQGTADLGSWIRCGFQFHHQDRQRLDAFAERYG